MNRVKNSLVAHASATKKVENQDYSIIFEGCFNAVIVADGIGSLSKAKEGAQEVVTRAEEILRASNVEDLDLKELFFVIHKDMQEMVLNKEENPEKNSYGTTLIIAIEYQDKFKVAYVGNGAILHMRGHITDFKKKVYYLPWACVNYLNPHTRPYKGRETLYKHFAYGAADTHVEPTIIEISKDVNGTGDILAICTDGIYSVDHMEVASDEDDTLWIEGTKTQQLLIHMTHDFLKEGCHHKIGLELALNHYLDNLKSIPNAMTDDCSLGLIITEQALKYQNQKDIENEKY